MCEVIKNLLTSNTFLTVVSGTLVFVLSQLFITYFLNPIKEFKELKAKISYTLIFYACYYSNPCGNDGDKDGKWSESSESLRKMAAEVGSFIQRKPNYNIFIASTKKLLEVQKSLIGLSNGCFNQSNTDYNFEKVENIEKLLCLKTTKQRSKNEYYIFNR